MEGNCFSCATSLSLWTSSCLSPLARLGGRISGQGRARTGRRGETEDIARASKGEKRRERLKQGAGAAVGGLSAVQGTKRLPCDAGVYVL